MGHYISNKVFVSRQRIIAFLRMVRSTLVLNYSVGNVEAEGTWKALGFEPILTVAVARPSELRQKLEK